MMFITTNKHLPWIINARYKRAIGAIVVWKYNQHKTPYKKLDCINAKECIKQQTYFDTKR